MPEPPALSAAIDLRVIGFAMALAVVTALGFGLLPALRATGSRAAALRPGTGRVLGGGKQARLLRVLVVAQIALSLLLVAGAGLFARSLYNLRSIEPGFNADRLRSEERRVGKEGRSWRAPSG